MGLVCLSGSVALLAADQSEAASFTPLPFHNANAVSDDAVPYAALLRGLGFAYAWFALFLFNALPLIGWLISLAALVLTVLSGVYAVRACMHVSTGKAALVCALSILTPLLLLKLLF